MQWEYKTLIYKKTEWALGSLEMTGLESLLNDHGRERWELVSAAPNANQGNRGLVLIFKRQR